MRHTEASASAKATAGQAWLAEARRAKAAASVPLCVVIVSTSALPLRAGAAAAPQLLEVHHDRFIRPHQVGQDLLAGAPPAVDLPLRAEKRPETVADVGGQHPFEILERRAAQPGIVRVQPAIGDL